MNLNKTDFLKALSKEITTQIPIYCTGYPESEFINNYINQYRLKINSKEIELNQKNYNFIDQMGFNTISLWDFRRGVKPDEMGLDCILEQFMNNLYLFVFIY